MGLNEQEKTPFWLVIPLCTLAAWIARYVPVWSVDFDGIYTVTYEDRWTLLLPMVGLSILAIVSRLIRRFGDSDVASGEAWRVLTAGCVLYLLGEFFSWPLAIVFRENFTALPKAYQAYPYSRHSFPLASLPVGIAFLVWSTFLLATARHRTWYSLIRHIGVAGALLLALLLIRCVMAVFWPRF